MKKMMMMAVVVAMGVAGPALAGTTIGYSGQLRDENGKAPTQLNQKITFALYDAPSGGVARWTAVRNVVLSEEGYFNVELEDDASVTNSLEEVLQKYGTLYIGLKPKGAAAEIAPRQRILETPHAAVATTGADGFKVSGAATISTIQAVTVQQQYVDGTEVKYGDLLPKGVIVMWSGSVTNVPAGWALCDGQNDRPDLRGRFVVGYDPNDADYDTSGKNGGAKTVTLTVDQMPKHAHTIDKGKVMASVGGSASLWVFGDEASASWKQYEYDTLTAGGEQPHENRPPYYAICYIIKM